VYIILKSLGEGQVLELKEEIGFLLEQKVCHNDKKNTLQKTVS
jgi:hypothetical protein